MDPDHPDPDTAWKLILESMGTSDAVFSGNIITQLGKLAIPGVTGPNTAETLNAHLAFVRAIHPQDELEAMLATQMAAVHGATMTAAARLSNTTDGTWIEIHEKALNKLSRTFTTQMEALKRYRSKGEQRVYVERVTVNEGGQAIVGAVTHGGGVDQKNEG